MLSAWWGALGTSAPHPPAQQPHLVQRRAVYIDCEIPDPGSSSSRNSPSVSPRTSTSRSSSAQLLWCLASKHSCDNHPASPYKCPSSKPSSCPTHRASTASTTATVYLSRYTPPSPNPPTTWSTARTAPRRSRPPMPRAPKPRSTLWARAQAPRSLQPCPLARASR